LLRTTFRIAGCVGTGFTQRPMMRVIIFRTWIISVIRNGDGKVIDIMDVDFILYGVWTASEQAIGFCP